MCQNETFQKQTFVYSFDEGRLNKKKIRNEYYMELGSCPVTLSPFSFRTDALYIYTSSRICQNMILVDLLILYLIFSSSFGKLCVCVCVWQLRNYQETIPQQPRNDKMLKDWNGTWTVGITMMIERGEIRILKNNFFQLRKDMLNMCIWFLSFISRQYF